MPEDVNRPSSRYRATSKAFDVVRPAQIYRARRQARSGRPGKLWAILKHYKKLDTEVRGAMQSVRSPITRQDLDLTLQDESQEAQRQRMVVKEALTRLGVDALIEDLLWGHYFGLRAHELDWETAPVEGTSYQLPLDAHRIPMSWMHARDDDVTDGSSTLYVGQRPLQEYDPGTVITYQDEEISKYEEVDFTTLGCGTAAARFGVFSWYSFEDWGAYNEAWGTPSVIGTLLQGWNSDDKDLLKQAVNNLGNDLRAIKTENGELELKWPEGSADGSTFDDLKRAAQKAIAVVIKSESLTDIDIDAGGSYAASRTTNGIRVSVADGISRRITHPLNEQIVQPITRQNFGRTLVKATIPVESTKNLLTQAKIDRTLNSEIGLELSRSELYERYNRRPPEDDDDRLPGGSGFDPLAGA